MIPREDPLFIYLLPINQTCQGKTTDIFLVFHKKRTGDDDRSYDLGEPLASPATFFSFHALLPGNPDSETSPMSKVSGRLSEDSTV